MGISAYSALGVWLQLGGGGGTMKIGGCRIRVPVFGRQKSGFFRVRYGKVVVSYLHLAIGI